MTGRKLIHLLLRTVSLSVSERNSKYFNLQPTIPSKTIPNDFNYSYKRHELPLITLAPLIVVHYHLLKVLDQKRTTRWFLLFWNISWLGGHWINLPFYAVKIKTRFFTTRNNLLSATGFWHDSCRTWVIDQLCIAHL